VHDLKCHTLAVNVEHSIWYTTASNPIIIGRSIPLIDFLLLTYLNNRFHFAAKKNGWSQNHPFVNENSRSNCALPSLSPLGNSHAHIHRHKTRQAACPLKDSKRGLKCFGPKSILSRLKSFLIGRYPTQGPPCQLPTFADKCAIRGFSQRIIIKDAINANLFDPGTVMFICWNWAIITYSHRRWPHSRFQLDRLMPQLKNTKSE